MPLTPPIPTTHWSNTERKQKVDCLIGNRKSSARADTRTQKKGLTIKLQCPVSVCRFFCLILSFPSRCPTQGGSGLGELFFATKRCNPLMLNAASWSLILVVQKCYSRPLDTVCCKWRCGRKGRGEGWCIVSAAEVNGRTNERR